MLFDKICTPNKTSRNSKLFYERKGKFYSCDRYENLSPLNNKNQGFLNRYWVIDQKLFILILESDLDPEKLCEHGT